MTSSSTTLVTEEIRLCSLPSATLVISPPDQGIQLQASAVVQLNLAKLPHEALQGLHTNVFQEIHHRDQQVHQQLGMAKQTIAQQNTKVLLAVMQQAVSRAQKFYPLALHRGYRGDPSHRHLLG